MLCQTAAPAPPPRALSQLTRRASASARVRRVAPSRALGFDLGEAAADKLRPEAEAQALVEDAASLLFAQDALRGPAAQAYLALLQQIALKASPTRLFTAYGAFFRAQQATGARTFADHVVDEVIAGKGNPLAETCARGAREPSALELAAVRADMDLLQRLCVSEATVLGWCERLAESATPRRKQPASWLAAAGRSAPLPPRRRRATGVHLGAPPRTRTSTTRTSTPSGPLSRAPRDATPWPPAAPVDARRAPRRDRRAAGLERRAAGAGQALGALRRGRGGREERFAVDGPQDQAPGFLWGRGRGRRAHRAVRRRRRRGHAPRACRRGHGVDGVRGTPSRRGRARRRRARRSSRSWRAPLRATCWCTARPGWANVSRRGPPSARGSSEARGACAWAAATCARSRDPRRGRRAPPRVVRALPGDAAVPDAVRGVPQRADRGAGRGGGGGAWPANATLVATALAPTGLKPGERDEGASLAGRFGRVVAMEAEE